MFESKMRFFISILIVFSFLLLPGYATSQSQPNVVLQILAINDFHGNLDPGKTLGGAEYLATLVNQQRAKNPHTVFVSAGDLIGATPLLSALFHDEVTIQAFNLMGLDFITTGNHEFDQGVEELKRIQKGGCHVRDGCQSASYTGAKFSFLTANVIDTATGQTLFPAYAVRTFDGIPVAFIGIALQSTPTIVNPNGVAGLKFENEAAAINATVAKLKQEGIKTIVVLLHNGGMLPGSNPNTCSALTGDILQTLNNTDAEVDLFITGHTHVAYNCQENNRVVTEAGANGSYLTSINLTLERSTGKIITQQVNNLPVSHDLPKDAAMTNLLDQYRALSAPLANRVIGSITRDITRKVSAVGESPLGDVITDAQLEATSALQTGGAVIAFTNPGGIRTDLVYTQSSSEGDGNVTFGELFAVQPFSNNLVTMTLNGAQLKELLEQQFTLNIVLQVSHGFTYQRNSAAPTGSQVAEMMLDGKPIEPAASYRVTVNSFLAAGGDGFSVFTQGRDLLTGKMDLDALVDYFAAHSPVAPGATDRIRRVP